MTYTPHRKALSKHLITIMLALNCLVAFTGAISADAPDILEQLASPRTLERLYALTQVADSNDPQLIDPVLAALKDKDENIRLEAISALHSLPSSDRVRKQFEKLLMTEKSPRVRAKTACALVRDYPASAPNSLLSWIAREVKRGRNIQVALEFPIGPRLQGDADKTDDLGCRVAHNPDEEARVILGLLLQNSTRENLPEVRGHLLDKNPQLRWVAAELITLSGQTVTSDSVSRAVADNDLAIVAGAHKQLIREGNGDSVPILVNALNQYGTPAMASHYLSSGNPELVSAAQQWASEHGYRGYEVSKRSSLEWGKHDLKNQIR